VHKLKEVIRVSFSWSNPAAVAAFVARTDNAASARTCWPMLRRRRHRKRKLWRSKKVQEEDEEHRRVEVPK
jgi:hypothetical protein